ncbi:MAG: hypothetical protein FWD66_06430 [Paludibacter sp.]|nr:hypothetical protein [Paludibacter sp.]
MESKKLVAENAQGKKTVVAIVTKKDNEFANQMQNLTGSDTKILDEMDKRDWESFKNNTQEPSIEELQAKAEKTAQLVQKYQTIKAKKAEVDSFVILHENEQAMMQIVDVKGRVIKTSNPKSIEQVLTIWKSDICEALIKAEKEVREIMSAQQPQQIEKVNLQKAA